MVLGVWLKMGLDWIIGFIDHLYTPLETTGNYGTIANLHTLQITIAPAKPFPASFLTSHPSKSF
jgi:hypothetical protein